MGQLTNDLSIISRLMDAMVASVDPDDLCNLLANDVMQGFEVAACYLAVLANDGKITMVGSWGYPRERLAPADRPSLWYPMAITDTIRTGKVQLYATWKEYTDKYPHLLERASPGKSFICIPFTTDGRRTGGLGLTFAHELSEPQSQIDIWQVMAQACNVFVSKSWAGKVFSHEAVSVVVPETTATRNRASIAFTTRELDVIRLTVDGLTAKEISMQLRFSESTIKQERMAIYKKLGISKASQVRSAAVAIGILGEG